MALRSALPVVLFGFLYSINSAFSDSKGPAPTPTPTPDPFPCEVCDLNQDGVVDEADLILLLEGRQDGQPVGPDDAEISLSDCWKSTISGRPLPAVEEITGQLQLPAPLDPSDYIVGNQLGTSVPDENGMFSLPVFDDGVTVTAAVPIDYTTGENAWMAVTCRVPSAEKGPEPPLIIDASTTASAFVLMHPFYLNPDPVRMVLVEDAFAGTPELQTLINLIDQMFPNELHPFEDQAFLDAYVAAVDAVADALPDVLVIDLDAKSGERSADKRVLRHSNPRVQAHFLDRSPQLELASTSDIRIKANAINGNPLDTIVRLTKVNLDGMHELVDGENSVGPIQLTSLDDVFKQFNQTSAVSPAFPLYETIESLSGSVVADAKSYARYGDLLKLISTAVVDALGIGGSGLNEFPLDLENDSVYILRGLNGRLSSGADPGELDVVLGRFRETHVQAAAANMFAAAIEFTRVFIAVNGLVKACVDEPLARIQFRILQELATEPFGELSLDVLLELVREIARDAGTSVLICVASKLATEPETALGATARQIINTINVTRKVAITGIFMDRTSAIAGINPLPFSNSPMDTALIVVGEPFSPVIHSVNGIEVVEIDEPLMAVQCGDPLVIEGIQFRTGAANDLPTVIVTDSSGRSVNITIEEGDFMGNVPGKGDPMQRITTTVPSGVSAKISIAVDNGGSRDDTPLILEIAPTLLDFPNNVFFLLDGVLVPAVTTHVEGRGFVRANHRIVIGTELLVPNDLSTTTRLNFVPPLSMPPGLHEVKIRWRAPEDDVSADPPVFMRVLQLPVIDTATPMEVETGQTLVLDGKNFGVDRELVDVFFQKPSGPMSNETPIRIIDNGTVGVDQVGQLFVKVDQAYFDPDPLTDEPEPIPLEVTVRTSAGDTLNSVMVNLVGMASGAFSRTLDPFHLPISTIINYANQNPAPPGMVTRECGGDGGNDCLTFYPDEWIPETFPNVPGHFGTFGVSPPPGLPAITGPCVPQCVNVGGFPGPQGWDGLSPNQINDGINFSPFEEEPYSIDLGGLPSLKGPLVSFFGDGNEHGQITGGGFMIDGMSDEAKLNNFLGITVTEGIGTVITIKNARGVILDLDITGNAAEVGLLIDNCKEITGDVVTAKCTTGVVIRNSEDCDLHIEASDYGTGVRIEGGRHNTLSFPELGYKLIRPATQAAFLSIPGDPGIGLHLTGGTTGNVIKDVDAVGNATGILIDDASENVVRVRRIGSASTFGPTGDPIYETTEGDSTGNGVGVQISAGAIKNKINGNLIANNDIGVLIDGGDGNIVSDLNFAAALPNPITEEFRIGNGVGLQMMGTAKAQPKGNHIVDNWFERSTLFGVEIDGVRERNIIENNLFSSADNFAENRLHNGNGGLSISNVSEKIEVIGNTFNGEDIAILEQLKV